MQATWRESDWRVDIQKQALAPESARYVPDPLLLLGVGSGNETMLYVHVDAVYSRFKIENSLD